MASLAGILQKMGYRVTGSDQNVYPPMSTQLQELGIQILEGYRAENLQPRPDAVIIGNVITRANPEAQECLTSGIAYSSLAETLGAIAIADRDSYVIAGTHGKTTTTSIMAWVQEQLGMNPGFLVGGIPLNFSRSFQEPIGKTFVIEGDEYDTAFFDKVPKFNHYKPRFVILTSIEFDHVDIYKDLSSVAQAFRGLVERIPSDGALIYKKGDKNIDGILSYCRAKAVSYGIEALSDEKPDYEARNIRFDEEGFHYSVVFGEKVLVEISSTLFGNMNVLNTLSVVTMAHLRGWDLVQVAQAIRSFKGVKRRQEILGEPRGVLVIEDFAHHPTAVDFTLQAVRQRFLNRKIWAVFEPRSATSRRKVFQNEYQQAFSQADEVIISEPFDKNKLGEDALSVTELVTAMNAKGLRARGFDNVEKIISTINTEASSGDIVVIMSNGAFGGIYNKLLSALGMG